MIPLIFRPGIWRCDSGRPTVILHHEARRRSGGASARRIKRLYTPYNELTTSIQSRYVPKPLASSSSYPVFSPGRHIQPLISQRPLLRRHLLTLPLVRPSAHRPLPPPLPPEAAKLSFGALPYHFKMSLQPSQLHLQPRP